MTGPEHRSALAALDQARPLVNRLDASRHPEELAADLIDAWSAVEAALRALAGGTSLTGQTLIRELRTRQVLSLEQANSLAEFQAARERALRTDYRPNDADVGAARQAFLKLEGGIMGGAMAAPSPYGPPGQSPSPYAPRGTIHVETVRQDVTTPPPASTTSALPPAGGAVHETNAVRSRQPMWVAAVLGLLAIAAIGGIGYWVWGSMSGGGSSDALDQGIAQYRGGQREQAVASFERAIRERPADPLPHVFLSRMAREVGNMPLAIAQADSAVRLGPRNSRALDEMGRVLLSTNRPDVAVRFFQRAVEADTTNKAAMGYLACAIARSRGNPEVAQRFLQRAGPGDWSNCARAPMIPPTGPGQPLPPGQQYPPGPYPPQQIPPGAPPPGGTYVPRTP